MFTFRKRRPVATDGTSPGPRRPARAAHLRVEELEPWILMSADPAPGLTALDPSFAPEHEFIEQRYDTWDASGFTDWSGVAATDLFVVQCDMNESLAQAEALAGSLESGSALILTLGADQDALTQIGEVAGSIDGLQRVTVLATPSAAGLALGDRVWVADDLVLELGRLCGACEAEFDLLVAEDATVVPAVEVKRVEVVFADSRIADRDGLLAGLAPDAEVLVLDSARDGLEQILGYLADRTEVGAIHLIGDGDAAQLHLGGSFLTGASIAGVHAGLLEQIGQHLGADADLMIYGCNFGAGEDGAAALQALARLTGADVAASTDRTGHASSDGGWALEAAAGVNLGDRVAAPVTVDQAMTGTAVNDAPIVTPFAVVSENQDAPSEQTRSSELVFIDQRVPDFQVLVDDLISRNDGSREVEIFLLDPSRDGIEQISQVLAQRHAIGALHLVSHGADGRVELGSGALDLDALREQATRIEAWRGALTEDADLLIYGCDVAATQGGEAMLSALSRLTGADVAASDDVTGSALRGGDWNLEYQTGRIETPLAVGEALQQGWSHTLATVTQRVAAASDDAEEEGPTGTTPNRMWLDSSDIELVSDFESPSAGEQRVGLRFTGMNIPAGATITGAYIVFRAVAADPGMTNSGATNLTLRGELTGDAATFTTTSGNISSRTLTGASAAWTPTAWTSGSDYNSSDISSVVQEIVNLGTWASGNDLAIIITGTGHRASQAYDSDPSRAAQLVVTYTTNDAPVNTVPGLQVTAVNTPLVFSTGNGNAISVSDSDDTSVSITLSANDGLLTLNGLAGLSFSAGDGSADATMTFTGTLASVNAALNGLQFSPTAAFQGLAAVQIGTTDFGGGGAGSPESDTDSITVEVGDVNHAPVNTVPAAQATDIGGMVLFSSATGTQISVSDADAGTSPVQVTLTAASGTINLSGNNGLTFTIGDGTADGTMTFTGTVADINTALNGMTFVAAAGFTGTAGVQITTNDLGNSGAGGALGDTDAISIAVREVDTAIWMASLNDVSSPGATGLTSWTGGQVLNLGRSGGNLLFEPGTTTGTFSLAGFNLDSGGFGDGNTQIDGLHYVSRNITVGGFALQTGDLLFSTAGNETLGGVAYEAGDIIRFRPTTAGNYSAGTFSLFFDRTDVGLQATAFTLVEQAVTVGGVTLNAGDLLISDNGSRDIRRFVPTQYGNTTSGSSTVFIDGDGGLNFGQDIAALALVEQTTAIGNTTLAAGSIILALVGDDASVGSGTTISVTRRDLFVLTATSTGDGTTSATASLLFQGADVGLDTNNEALAAATLIANQAPTLGNQTLGVPENSANGTVVGTVTGSDPEGGTVRYAITAGNLSGAFTINGTTGQITVANSAALDFETTPAFTLSVAAIDTDGAYGAATVTVNLANVNEAPTATNLNAAETYTEDTPLNLVDIVISDVDSVNVTATLTLSNVAAGSLNTGTSGAVTSTYNAGTGVWTASGAVADVNALLAGLTLTPTANYNSTFTIATSVSDGVAAPITGVKTLAGTPVNDAPVITTVAPDVTFVEGGLPQVIDASRHGHRSRLDGLRRRRPDCNDHPERERGRSPRRRQLRHRRWPGRCVGKQRDLWRYGRWQLLRRHQWLRPVAGHVQLQRHTGCRSGSTRERAVFQRQRGAFHARSASYVRADRWRRRQRNAASQAGLCASDKRRAGADVRRRRPQLH